MSEFCNQPGFHSSKNILGAPLVSPPKTNRRNMAATTQNDIQSITRLYENLGFYRASRRPIGSIRTLTHNWRRQYLTPSGTPGTQLLDWNRHEHDLVEMATKYLETDRNGIIHWPSNNRDNPGYPAAPRYPQDEAL